MIWTDENGDNERNLLLAVKDIQHNVYIDCTTSNYGLSLFWRKIGENRATK